MPISVITPTSKGLRTKTFIAEEGASVEVCGIRKGAAILGFIVNPSATSIAGVLDIGYKSGSGDELVAAEDLALVTSSILLGTGLMDQTTGLLTNGLDNDRTIVYTLTGAGSGPYAVTILYADVN